MHLEEVKEYFKNAKEIGCPYDGMIFNFNVKGFFEEVEEGNVLFKFDKLQDGIGSVYLYYEGEFSEIISYNKEEDIFKERVMLVSDDEENWWRRVVFMKKNNRFIAWNYAKTIEDAGEVSKTTDWSYAKEYEEVVEVTKEDIAKWKGCDVNQLIIK